MINIKVFGIGEEYVSKEGGCGSPSGCDIDLSIGEQYESLIEFLRKKNVMKNIDLRFIDIRYIDEDKHTDLKRMIEVGFSIPYVYINEKIRFFGAIPEKAILEEINKLLKTTPML